jgi:hypothetical protein
MNEPFKIDRKLPPHELNARRARKRVVTKLPAIAHLPLASDHSHEPKSSPNDHVFNHGADAISHHE